METLKIRKGFALMEVMIAAGLLAVVSMGVIQLTKMMAKSSKSQAQKFEFSNLETQIQSILRDEYSCAANFNGINPSGDGSALPQLVRKRSDGTSSTVFQSGKPYGGDTPIFLKKMELKNYDP